MPTTAAKQKSSAGDVFTALKRILESYAKRANIVKDTPTEYILTLRDVTWRKRPVWFAAVRDGRAYTSFHLMPIYMNPALQRRISPELKRRMQGKSCFNFQQVDEKLFAQLADLTAAGFDAFQKTDWAALEARHGKSKRKNSVATKK